LDTISYFEVPEKDAKKVMIQLTGIRYKGRQIRCNDSEDGAPTPKSIPKGKNSQKNSSRKYIKGSQDFTKKRKERDFIDETGDWRSLMKKVPRDLRGPEPDFSEEGWAMRKPRKKKK